MRGFGSDSRFTSQPELNAGFGRPSSIGSSVTTGAEGFGSTTPLWAPQAAAVLPYTTQYEDYPDDGGSIVRLVGSVWPVRGPWVVRLTSDSGATFHPSDNVGCYSGTVGNGHLCYTDRFQRVLPFVLPPLPVGTYDVWVDWAGLPAFGASKLVAVLDVVTRNSAEEVYSIRRTYPPRYRTGPRAWSLEDATLPSMPLTPLRCLTRALGQVAQQMGGSPQTRLLQPFTLDDAFAEVESTLGFPPAGEIWIGPLRYSYASLTASPNRFVTLTVIGGSADTVTLPALTEVTCHAPAILPV